MALAWDVDRPGWLDPAVHALAGALGRAGASCELVTLGTGPTSTRHVDGVDVTWVAEAPPVLPATSEYDVARVLAAATRASGAAERRCRDRLPDAVLAVGWQTAYTATTLRTSRGLPIVAHLASTAPGRARGGLDDTGRMAAQVEWWLTYEARRVVASNAQVRAELQAAFRLPAAKIDVIPPGAPITSNGPPTPDRRGWDAVVVGPPAMVRAVRRRLRGRAVSHDPDDLSRATVAVVMHDDATDLVLRAMAAGAAVVVPDDGPLRGLVHARRSGVRVTREPRRVAETAEALLGDVPRCRRLGQQAQQRVAARHDWPTIARRHLDVAARAVQEETDLNARSNPPRPLRPQLLRSPILGLVDTGHPPTNGPRHAEEHG